MPYYVFCIGYYLKQHDAYVCIYINSVYDLSDIAVPIQQLLRLMCSAG
jgi:hypothetical protein